MAKRVAVWAALSAVSRAVMKLTRRQHLARLQCLSLFRCRHCCGHYSQCSMLCSGEPVDWAQGLLDTRLLVWV